MRVQEFKIKRAVDVIYGTLSGDNSQHFLPEHDPVQLLGDDDLASQARVHREEGRHVQQVLLLLRRLGKLKRQNIALQSNPPNGSPDDG